MGFMTIDGKQVEFTDEPNVLSVIRKADIDIPTLCYHSELSVYGACRLCTVENEKGKTFASCSEKPKDGMVVYTNTPRLMKYRKMILELLLAAHDRDCTTCIKSGECHLQELAHRMGVTLSLIHICTQGLEFVLAGEHTYPDDYPKEGEEITVTGIFDIYEEDGFKYCQLINASMEQ